MASSPTESVEGSYLLHSHNGSLNKPLNSTEASLPPSRSDATSTRWLVIYSLLTVLAYLVLGVVVFTSLSGMSALDSLYFCVVTLTTVGYGDLSAHKPLTKLFACFYIFIGVAMVAAFLATLVETLLDKQEDLLMVLFKKRRAEAMQGDVDDQVDSVNESSPGAPTSPSLQRANLELTAGVTTFLMLLLLGVVVFKFSGDMSIIDALYLTVVSSSTVGYGDYYPSTQATKIFAIFFLPLSTLLLGKVISDYTEMRVAGKTEARQHRILLATITMKDYKTMDKDGDGHVSPLEFMCRTLVAQEKVTQEDIDEVMCRFSELDKNGNGFLEFAECAEC